MDLREIATGMSRVKNTIAIMRADDINTKRQAVACYDFLTDLEAKLTQYINEQALKPAEKPPEEKPQEEKPES